MIIIIEISINNDQAGSNLSVIIDCHWVFRSLRCRYDRNCQIYHYGLTARAVDGQIDPLKIRLGALLFETWR